MLNIMIAVPTDEMGGAEQFLFNIAKYYSDRGESVDVFFFKKEKTRHWRKLKGASLSFTFETSEMRGIIPFIKNIRKKRRVYDYVFSSHQHMNALLSLLVKFNFLKKKKLVVRESTSVYKRFTGKNLIIYDLLYRLFYTKNIDLLICQTDDMKHQLIQGCKKLMSFNVKVIPNPIIVSDIIANSEVCAFDSQYLIAVGRLHKVKRFDRLIEAYSQCSAREKFELWILGEGNERPNLERLIERLDLIGKVKLLGHQKNVYPYIKSSKLGVISSDFEGFPNVLLQMYALDLRVVMTKCCGGLEQFPNLGLVEDFSSESLAKSIDDMLRLDSVYNNKDYVLQFDIHNFIRILEEDLGQ